MKWKLVEFNNRQICSDERQHSLLHSKHLVWQRFRWRPITFPSLFKWIKPKYVHLIKPLKWIINTWYTIHQSNLMGMTPKLSKAKEWFVALKCLHFNLLMLKHYKETSLSRMCFYTTNKKVIRTNNFSYLSICLLCAQQLANV